nr:hypothetical protein [uncultured Carboxylicivirga sp.]
MKVTIRKSKEGSYYRLLPDELIEEFNLETGDLFELLPDHNGIQIIHLPKKKILTRDGEETDQLYEVINREIRGVRVSYLSCYYLDDVVDEETFKIDKTHKEKFYTEEQKQRNIEAFKIAYHNALINQIDPTTLHYEIDFGGPVGNEEW